MPLRERSVYVSLPHCCLVSNAFDVMAQAVDAKLKERPDSDWLHYRRAALMVMLDKERQKSASRSRS